MPHGRGPPVQGPGSVRDQGFRITDSKPTSHGFKAALARSQGSPNDTVELDAKLKHGWRKVEIEFDE